jgi:RNA polymerase-binding transcription factor DksA
MSHVGMREALMTKLHLSERELRPLARTLERREAELRRKIVEERERADDEGLALAKGAGDAADQAFARIQFDIDYQRIDGVVAELRELAAARERLENGVFGVCVDCGEPIDPARLNVAPAAARCAICQERYEYAHVLRH